MDDLIGKLRVSCKPVHYQVEQTFLLQQLVAGNISENDYLTLLQTMHGICADFSQYFQHNLAHTPYADFIDYACRLVELKQDLSLLGQYHAYSPQPLIEFADDPDAAMGAMYVLLGAANGAQYLSQAIDRNPNPQVKAARQFFSNNITLRLQTWKRFVDALSLANHRQAQHGCTVHAAVSMFGYMSQQLDRAVWMKTSEVSHG